MDIVDFKDLQSGQARRMRLLLELIERCSHPEEALELAERMEHFVQSGSAKVLADAPVVHLDDCRRKAKAGEKSHRSVGSATGPEFPDEPSLADSGTIGASLAPTQNAVAEPNSDGAPLQVCTPIDLKAAINPKTGTVYTKRRWTAEEDAQLKKLAAEDQTLDQIARVLDRTPIGIRERARAKHIKIKPRKRGRHPTKSIAKPAEKPSGPTSGKTGPHGRQERLSAGAKRARTRKKHRSSDPKRDADMVRAFLMEHGPTRPTFSIETVVKFMRTRDYSVVMGDDGRYVVDGRDRMTPQELVKRANALRIDLGQSTFPEDPGSLNGNGSKNGATPYLSLGSEIQVAAHGPN